MSKNKDKAVIGEVSTKRLKAYRDAALKNHSDRYDSIDYDGMSKGGLGYTDDEIKDIDNKIEKRGKFIQKAHDKIQKREPIRTLGKKAVGAAARASRDLAFGIDKRLGRAVDDLSTIDNPPVTRKPSHRVIKNETRMVNSSNIKENTMQSKQDQISALKAKIAEAKFAKMTVPSLGFKGNAKELISKFNESFGVDFSVDEARNRIINLTESENEYKLFATLRKFLESKGVKTSIVEYDNSRLSHLLEGELEKAQVVLASKDILDSLQKIAEQLAKIQTDSVMPLVDEIKMQFGSDVASKFEAVAKEHLDSAFDTIRTTKDNIGDEVAKLQAVVDGEEIPTDLETDPLNEPKSDLEAGLDTPEVDLDVVEPDAFTSDTSDEPLGRVKKESRVVSKKAVTESKKKK